MDENKVVADNSNTAEDTAPEADKVEGEETIEQVRARAEKAEELAKNYKIRAEKAEKKPKEVKAPEAPQSNQQDLSSRDMFVLIEAKVPQDDVDEVVEYARFKKISVADALKTSTIKAMLAERLEERNVASATNVGPSKRVGVKITDDAIIEKANKGNVPEDASDLAAARHATRMKALRR